MKKKYVCPMDLFGGIIKKGDIVQKDKHNDNDSYYHKNKLSWPIPAEIVETWPELKERKHEDMFSIGNNLKEAFEKLAESIKLIDSERTEIKKENESLREKYTASKLQLSYKECEIFGLKQNQKTQQEIQVLEALSTLTNTAFSQKRFYENEIIFSGKSGDILEIYNYIDKFITARRNKK